MLNQEYWNARYQEGRTGWDIQGVSPAFLAWAQNDPQPNDAILIPGCGNAHEAQYLIEKGFSNIHLLDFAAQPMQQIRQLYDAAIQQRQLKLHVSDFFAFQGQFDWIFEQTFFCALPPHQRPDYVQTMYHLLKPKGKLVGLLFNRHFAGPEPPFGGSIAEYQTLFDPFFHLHHLAPTSLSILPRLGTEVWIQFSKKL